MSSAVRRRVVHHIPSLRHGGAERQLSYLAPALVEIGWDVHVIVSDAGANLDRIRAGGATVHAIGAGARDPRAATRTIGLIRALRPAIVHTWLTRSDILGGIGALVNGVPWILSEGSSAAAYPPGWQSRLRRLLAWRATGIVSNSSGGDAYWASMTGGRVPRFIVRNAIPLGEIDRAPARPCAGEGPCVLYAGGLRAEKNVERLIAALAMVRPRTPCRAVLLGEGPTRAAIAQAVVRHGLEGSVELAGEVETVWEHMKGADLFASISLFEGSPNTVLEAMACRCPLLLSDIDAHRELAADTACYVDPLSVESIARGIVDALSDRGRMARVERGRAVAATADISRRVAELADVYDRVAARTA